MASQNGEVYIGIGVICHSSWLDCDRLVEQFKQINEELKRRLEADASS